VLIGGGNQTEKFLSTFLSEKTLSSLGPILEHTL